MPRYSPNVNSNLNGDSTAIDRAIINPNGVKGTATTVKPQFATNLANLCPTATTPDRHDSATPTWLAMSPSTRMLTTFRPGRYASQRGA